MSLTVISLLHGFIQNLKEWDGQAWTAHRATPTKCCRACKGCWSEREPYNHACALPTHLERGSCTDKVWGHEGLGGLYSWLASHRKVSSLCLVWDHDYSPWAGKLGCGAWGVDFTFLWHFIISGVCHLFFCMLSKTFPSLFLPVLPAFTTFFATPRYSSPQTQDSFSYLLPGLTYNLWASKLIHIFKPYLRGLCFSQI